MEKPVSRAVAFVFGLFLALNAAARMVWPQVETTVWLVDVRRWNGVLGRVVIAIVAAALIAFAIRSQMGNWRRRGTLGVVALLAAIAIADSVRVFALDGGGAIRAGSPVPFSLFVAVGLGIVAMGVVRKNAKPVRFGPLLAAGVVSACFAAFPLLQMLTFGLTDYRRHADVIVVFGARAYADGRPSSALSDRMKTAFDLYREGLAANVILSGGPGDGAIHETDVMRQMAIDAGVPDVAIIVDRDGLNTRLTIANAARIARERGFDRVLAVSHFYHLPRIKLQADREGLVCFTVPSPQQRPLIGMPYFVAREAAACWVYYLRP